ncbi:AMP-binding protein [Ruegeria faecimaris]|uniref:AMP-binding protein n=1 Tax=Ruegeria faecimaris TaxID=686389 RepID=UPI00232ACCB8|nr:AMP-binding protein [Ruegeria faecimaris]
MVNLGTQPIRTQSDISEFEEEMTLEERLPEQSILDVFINSADRDPDATALTMLMTGTEDEEPRRVTYKQLLGQIMRAANLFAAIGGEAPGVAFMLPALIETHVTLWGAETAGYAVPINFLLQPESIAELLKASEAKILVALGPHPRLDIWEKALAMREQVPGLVLVRVSPPGTPPEEGVIDLASALMAQPDDHLTFGEARRGSDLAAYFHTGGTTGVPKLVAHTHRSQLVAAFGGAVMCGFRSDDVFTATFPLFHVAGTIVGGLSCFMAGVELLVMTPAGLRNPAVVASFWRLVAEYKVTIVGGVPTAIGAILQTPIGDHDISHVRAGATGASLLPPAVGQKFKEVTGCTLFEILGMTEASGLISIDPLCGTGTAGSVGWALPYTNVDVLKLESDGGLGAVCEIGEIGVVAIKGPHVSPGYSVTEFNSEVFVDGVLNSGDLGYKDANGCLYVAGRSKDLIIRSGHNIDPVMIENAMSTHPAVALAAAVGMPDPYAGELPICFIQVHTSDEVTVEDLMAHAQNTIDERPAWPKIIKIVDEIPLTSVGKIFKPSLRCDAARLVVSNLLREQLKLPDAHVQVEAGGPRGLCVTVSLSGTDASSRPSVEEKLQDFLFETRVEVGS